MNIRHILFFMTLALLLSSCGFFERRNLLENELMQRNLMERERLAKEEAERALREQVLNRFKEIRELIAEKKFVEAENKLAQMREMVEYQSELEDLQELVNLARNLLLSETDLAIDRKRILNESEVGTQLPRSYGKVINVSPDDESPRTSELERLLDRPVSMKISNMPLGELAMQLRDLEGLNIADPVNVIFNDEVLQGKTFSANFKDVPLREIFDYLAYNLQVEFNICGNMIWVTKSAAEATGPRLVSRIIPLRQGIIPTVPEGIGVVEAAKVTFETTKEEDLDLDNALKAFYEKTTTGGSYQLFPQRNVLLVRDTLENIRYVEQLVETFSKPPNQVLIEAKFLMVSESDLRDVGIELSHYNGGKTGENIDAKHQTNGNLSDFFTRLGNLAADAEEGVSSLTISGIIGNRSFDMLIRALERKSSTVTLSAPRIATFNNRTARMRKGDKMYYFEEYQIQSVDRGEGGTDQILVPTGKPSSLALGITFDVKPSIGADGKTILLGLKPEIVTFLQWEDFSSTTTVTNPDKSTTKKDTEVKLPRYHEQTVATSVGINSGETVILGGMVENRETTEVKRVPFLGDIPFIGALFRHTSVSREPTNLLIFVTATIINERGEYVVVNR